VRDDHTLACWGYNFYGQVRRAPAGQHKQVDSGAGHSCAISTTNEAVYWGRNDRRQADGPAIGGPSAGVGFDFEGFYSPVKADPTLNVVKAGSSVPLKFSLGGDRGLDVLAVGSPASGPLDCAGLEPGGDLAPANGAGGSALTYDPVADQYTWAWKTDKTWACSSTRKNPFPRAVPLAQHEMACTDSIQKRANIVESSTHSCHQGTVDPVIENRGLLRSPQHESSRIFQEWYVPQLLSGGSAHSSSSNNTLASTRSTVSVPSANQL
jgi:hypothetical protein